MRHRRLHYFFKILEKRDTVVARVNNIINSWSLVAHAFFSKAPHIKTRVNLTHTLRKMKLCVK